MMVLLRKTKYSITSALNKCLLVLLLIVIVVGSAPFSGFAATSQIRQEINILAGETLSSSSSSQVESQARVQLDTTQYSGTATYYFEAVYAGAASNTGTIKLSRAGTATYDASLAGATSSTNILTRSSSFTPPAGATEYTVSLVGDGTRTQTVKSARIIVIQSTDPLASTETQIEMGTAETAKNNTTAAALSAPKYWNYEADNWDAGQVFYAEAIYKTNAVATTDSYTSSTSWVAPTGVTSATIKAWGAGGGGGGVSGSPAAGGGGAGGAFAQKVVAVTPNASYTVTVGTGGTAGASGGGNGGTGNPSWFSTTGTVFAQGGVGGSGSTTNANFAGGTGSSASSIGDTVYAGGNGATGNSTTGVNGGAGGGGAGTTGAGGNASGGTGGTGTSLSGGNGATGVSSAPGGTGSVYGGGGSGGDVPSGGTNRAGGAGAAGRVEVTYDLTYPVTVKLQEDDGSFANWADKVTIVNAASSSTAARVRSVAFTPTDGRNYRIVTSISNASGSYDIYSAKIIARSNQIGYDSKSVSVGTQDALPRSAFFKPDGTKMYIVGRNNGFLYQYSLSTAWDVSTATYDSVSFQFSTQETIGTGLWFKPDGTKMYIVGTNSDTVFQYSLPTPWSLTGATYDSVSFSIATQEGGVRGLTFKPDGTKMYATGLTTVFQYSLSSAWVVSSASYDSVSYAFTSQGSNMTGLQFNSDGSEMYTVDAGNEDIYRYTLSTPYVVNTATYTNHFFDIASQETNVTGIFLKGDDSKIYMVGTDTDTVYQYSVADITKLETQYLLANNSLVSTGLQSFLTKWDSTEWSGVGNTYVGQATSVSSGTSDLRTALAERTYSIGSQTRNISFKSDGTKMYVIANNGTAVYQYSLSTAWDVTTASYDSVSFTLTSQDSTPRGLFFKPDGTKMYMAGPTNDTIYQYSLSSAWDLSTASYDSVSLSITAKDTDVRTLFFKSDGTEMYILGQGSATTHQYTLSTPWVISSGTFTGSGPSHFSLDTFPNGLFFNPDGTKMYFTGSSTGNVYQYTLSTPWAVTSATYDSVLYASGNGLNVALYFKSDGARFYTAASNNVYEHFTFTPWSLVSSSITDVIQREESASLTMPDFSANLDVMVTTNSNNLYSSAILVRVGPAPSTSFTQSGYRFFTNANSTSPGSTLASQDTAATLQRNGDTFRLRMLIHIADLALSQTGEDFKLQFAEKSGSCDTGFSGETYADVTDSTAIAYRNNYSPSNGDNLSTTGNDPTHSGHTVVAQTYVEANNFSNGVNAIPAGQDGLWDFSLVDKAEPASATSYCFRIVKSDGEELDTYSVIPEVSTIAYRSRGGGGGSAGGESSATPNTTQTGGGSGGGGGAAGGEGSGNPNNPTGGGGQGGGGGDSGWIFIKYNLATLGTPDLAFFFKPFTGDL